MADISSITLPGGGTYDLKDKNAVHKSDLDLTPTASSTNPVQSGGVYSATAGYGLGVMLNTQTAIADCDGVSVTGWFNTDNNTLHCPTGANKNSVLYCVTRGAQYAYQEFYDPFNAKLYRRWKNQTSPWEAWHLSDNGFPAFKQDLTSIQATGTTNTTGAAIPAGALFYLNGILHRAKEQINVNATFTVNTNCEQVPEGGLNAFLPSIINGTLDTTKVSGYAQAISAGSLHMVFFKLTTSVAVAISDVLVSFPSGTAPAVRQQPLQFLFQRPSDVAPVIREDRAGAYFNTNGTITQSLSNALTVGTLLQGFFIWIG